MNNFKVASAVIAPFLSCVFATSALAAPTWHASASATASQLGTASTFQTIRCGGNPASTCAPSSSSKNSSIIYDPTLKNPVASSSVSGVYAGMPVSAYAMASADLATGSLHIYTTETLVDSTRANAVLQDTVHFASAYATVADVILHVDGSFGLGAMPNFRFSMFNADDNLTANVGFRNLTGGIETSDAADQFLTFEKVGDWTAFGPEDYLGHIIIAAGGSDYSLQMSLNSMRGFADFSHTAALRFVLPSDVTFSSDSGALLSGVVPEPTTWAMMLLGFGLLGGVARGRNKGTGYPFPSSMRPPPKSGHEPIS